MRAAAFFRSTPCNFIQYASRICSNCQTNLMLLSTEGNGVKGFLLLGRTHKFAKLQSTNHQKARNECLYCNWNCVTNMEKKNS